MHYLREAKLRKGERILVNGAGGSFAESVLPVVEAGQAMAVAVDYALDGEVWYVAPVARAG